MKSALFYCGQWLSTMIFRFLWNFIKFWKKSTTVCRLLGRLWLQRYRRIWKTEWRRANMIMCVGKGALGASIHSQNKKAPDILDRMANLIDIHDFNEFSRLSQGVLYVQKAPGMFWTYSNARGRLFQVWVGHRSTKGASRTSNSLQRWKAPYFIVVNDFQPWFSAFYEISSNFEWRALLYADF